jgi:hypothetical protein
MGFAPADTLDIAVLEARATPFAWRSSWRDLIDIIEQQGSLVCQFEPSTSLAQRPGERALFITE